MNSCDFGDLASAFARDGFVNGGTVLSDAELDDIRAEVERFADVQLRSKKSAGPVPCFQELGHDPDTRHFRMVGAWRISAVFRRLIENERILNCVAAISGAKSLQPWVDTVQYKPARFGGPVNWHQDGAYHYGIEPAGRLVTAWIAFDDADEESGCMWMVPGSHRWGNKELHLQKYAHLRERADLALIQPPEDLDPSQWRGAMPCPVRAGEVHFHHAFTWHSSPMNRSDRMRRGYTIFYMPEGIRIARMTGMSPGKNLSDVPSREFPILFRA